MSHLREVEQRGKTIKYRPCKVTPAGLYLVIPSRSKAPAVKAMLPCVCTSISVDSKVRVTCDVH